MTYDRFKLIVANTVWTREIDPDPVLGRGWVTVIVFQTSFVCVCGGGGEALKRLLVKRPHPVSCARLDLVPGKEGWEWG